MLYDKFFGSIYYRILWGFSHRKVWKAKGRVLQCHKCWWLIGHEKEFKRECFQSRVRDGFFKSNWSETVTQNDGRMVWPHKMFVDGRNFFRFVSYSEADNCLAPITSFSAGRGKPSTISKDWTKNKGEATTQTRENRGMSRNCKYYWFRKRFKEKPILQDHHTLYKSGSAWFVAVAKSK